MIHAFRRSIGWTALLIVSSVIADAQSDPTVYVTRTGSKYHSANCAYLRGHGLPVKLSEAAKRLSPCSRCNPPILEAKGEAPRPSRSAHRPAGPDSSQQSVGTTSKGDSVYIGPRGGRYHYSKSGKKIYERKRR